MVRAASEWRLAMGGAGAVALPLRAAVCTAAFAIAEEESDHDLDDRDFHHLYTHRGRFLAGRAELRGCEAPGFHGFLARLCGSDRVRRIVAGYVFPNFAHAAVNAARGSRPSKGIGSWQR